MTAATAGRLARASVIATTLLVVVSVGLAWANRSVEGPVLEVALGVVLIVYAVIGSLIVSRQPSNAIGWLFCGVAVYQAALAGVAHGYAVFSLVTKPGGQSIASVALWLQSAGLDSLFFLMVILLLLLFPTGKPLTPRWRIAVWASAAGAVMGLAASLRPYTIEPPLEAFHNPLIIGGTMGAVLSVAANCSFALFLLCFVAGVVSVALRFHRSRGIERQQMKWFVAGVGLELVVITLTILAAVAGYPPTNLTFYVVITVLPVTVGIAILRYRLYEIDVIIRRTLVYGALIATLAALYLGSISLIGWVLRSATGQSSALAVTLSTLAVAIAFQPLRHRIQRAVDHRFYRRKYDAAHTLEQFDNRLREQVDLDALHTEVLTVLTDTVQPSHATLWLRPAKPKLP